MVGLLFCGAGDIGEALVVGGVGCRGCSVFGGDIRGAAGGGAYGSDGDVAGLFYGAETLACATARLRRIAARRITARGAATSLFFFVRKTTGEASV